jgi:hypothetical protein
MSDAAFISLARAATLWPAPEGQPVHSRRVRRAIEEGKPSRRCPGESIKLQAVHNGSAWLTTEAWIQAYLEQLSADRGGKPAVRDRQQRARLSPSRATQEHW